MPLGSAILDEQTGCIIEEISAPPIRYLVFEGGGVRGIAYAGVIEELERAKILGQVEHVAGSSIGAVTAMLVALGYSAEELVAILGNLNFKKYLEGQKPWYITPQIIVKGKEYLTILATDGHSLSSGKLFKEWIEEKVERKLGKKDATFADLAAMVGSTKDQDSLFKFLSVTGSNVSKNRIEVFNHLKTPNMPIALAVRISSAFPTVFKAVEWDNGQGVSLYMDGGLVNNLPYFIFHDRDSLRDGFDFTDKAANASVLNIKVDTSIEVAQVLWNKYAAPLIRGIKEYTAAILNAMQSRDTEIYEQYSTNTIQVDDCGSGTLEFDQTERQRTRLRRSGQENTLEWVQSHVKEAYQVNRYPSVGRINDWPRGITLAEFAEREWLASKNEVELAAIRKRYLEMLEKGIKTNANSTQIKTKIDFLEKYMHWRVDKLNYPELPDDLAYTPHINLHVEALRHRSDQVVESNMRKMLTAIHAQISNLKKKIMDNLCSMHPVNKLHDSIVYDVVACITKLKERLKLSYLTEVDLLNKLNFLKSDNQYKAPSIGKCFHDFKEMINTDLTHRKSILHMPVLASMNSELEAKAATCLNDDDTIPICLNLEDKDDFKIFLVSYMLYFSYIQSNDHLAQQIKEFYTKTFNIDSPPKNLEELGRHLQKDWSDTLIAAYRIEKLIKRHMAMDRPKEKDKFSLLTIDHVFSALSFPNKKRFNIPRLWEIKDEEIVNKETANALEMDVLYESFSCTDKYMMFHKVNSTDARIEDIDANKVRVK